MAVDIIKTFSEMRRFFCVGFSLKIKILSLFEMLSDELKRKVQNITSGTLIEGSSDHCTTIRNILCRSYPTSTTVKKNFESNSVAKEEQATLIEEYCLQNNFWIQLPQTYLTRGGEARVYLDDNKKDVIKVNDGVYYATWLEFLNSIQLHNLFFENTAYDLQGFHKENNALYAVLRQPFIVSDTIADLRDIKSFLEFNGFENTRRQDYLHREFGLILEDMHDENVILHNELLFFIDTVFYVDFTSTTFPETSN